MTYILLTFYIGFLYFMYKSSEFVDKDGNPRKD